MPLAGRSRVSEVGATPITPATSVPLAPIYVLEQLRAAFQAKGAPGRALLAGWLAWAQRCRIPEFVKLARTIKRFLPLIYNTLDHGLSNALSEATNTHI
jgi:transposase